MQAEQNINHLLVKNQKNVRAVRIGLINTCPQSPFKINLRI